MIKIFAISIPRYRERHEYIRSELASKTALPWDVVGIDALELRKDADVWDHNQSLRDSEVGCALSHVAACERIVSEGLEYALIVEDDVVLPNNIDSILLELSSLLRCGEVVSLYNRTLRPEKFSKLNSEKVLKMRLIYPMETRFMRTAAAYFIDRQAAKMIAAFNNPVRVVADNWAAYYQSRVIVSIRLLHPIPISLKPFESTLSFDRGNSFQRISKTIFNLPIFRKIRALRRRYLERKRERHLILVDLPSDQIRNV